jgi:hypothetical protein
MKLRRFNDTGFAAFCSYRQNLSVDPTLVPPDILESPDLTELIEPELEIVQQTFQNRLEAGVFLNQLISRIETGTPEKDVNLWTWLTLFFFDQVCPPDEQGRRKPMHEARLVPHLESFRHFYRHLLFGPFLIVRAHIDHPQRALVFLCNPLSQPGTLVEEFASRQELITNRGIVELSTNLYYDETTASFKRGSATKVKGGSRRLTSFLNQLDLTYYLYGMAGSEIEQLLPPEFNRFRTPTAAR